MRLSIIAIGQGRDPEYRNLIEAYHNRIQRYATLEEVSLREEPNESAAKTAEKIDKVVAQLGKQGKPYVIALEVNGKQFTSPQFAQHLERVFQNAQNPVFIVGGAYGLPVSISEKAQLTLSLGTMTYPHRLAQLILAEQVYRAFTILKNEPYAHQGTRK